MDLIAYKGPAVGTESIFVDERNCTGWAIVKLWRWSVIDRRVVPVRMRLAPGDLHGQYPVLDRPGSLTEDFRTAVIERIGPVRRKLPVLQKTEYHPQFGD